MGLFYDRGAQAVRGIYDMRIAGPPVLDAARLFPDAAKFVADWRDIRNEAAQVSNRLRQVPRFHEIMPEQADISAHDGRDWRLFILKAYGVPNAKNMAACPVLAQIVDNALDVLSASFSFMEAGKHVPAYRGPFRGVLRFYLGLSVPLLADNRPAAALKIDDEEYRVGAGEWLLWDDTYSHEVWNHGSELRSVLLLDVWRRDMPVDMRLLSLALVATGVRLRGPG
jgi:aspartate beta-hydroxylase